MNKGYYLLILSSLVFIIASCNGQKAGKEEITVKRDTTITMANSYAELFLDSMALENFLTREGIKDTFATQYRNFYNGRNYQYAWFTKNGADEQALNFWSTQAGYIGYSGDSSLYNPALQMVMDSIMADSNNVKLPDSVVLRSELELTRQFYRYADKAYQGNDKLNLQKLDWFIPRKKINIVALLDSVIRDNGKNLEDLEPVNKQYNLLKPFLLKYYQLERESNWGTISTTKKKIQEGDEDDAVPAIKKRLGLLGDYTGEDTAKLFTPALADAVKSYQGRYGLKTDGVIGTALLAEMNRPISERIQQLLINMERMRWVPAQPTTDYLLVNIPEYKLHAYENGKLVWDMVVVVGSTQHSTTIFTGDLKNIVFSPYWNVPNSIVKKEVLPGIARNKNYLASHNMIMDASGVRQKPGPRNSLGLVKFLFPNSYSIYLHDTPSKSLFGETNRAFSHGCIRLAEPAKLADWLLRNDSSWTDAKIAAAMNAGKERYVPVKQKVPVFIGYFTAWVDSSGKLNFRDDVYGHDKEMAAQLFGKISK